MFTEIFTDLAREVTTQQFWSSLLKIIGIDILLSGDNAVVIALACRSLPPRQQRWGIILGTGAAIVLRVIFAVFIVYLLTIPYLKIAGGLLLLWIAVKLLMPEQEAHDGVESRGNIWGAVQTIVMADVVMSLDNVIGVAAAAKGSVLLLVLGLLISIPLIVWGSTLILRLIDRFPIIVTLGGALLGYVAGEVLIGDPLIAARLERAAPVVVHAIPALTAVLVVLAGSLLARRRQRRAAA